MTVFLGGANDLLSLPEVLTGVRWIGLDTGLGFFGVGFAPEKGTDRQELTWRNSKSERAKVRAGPIRSKCTPHVFGSLHSPFRGIFKLLHCQSAKLQVLNSIPDNGLGHIEAPSCLSLGLAKVS